MLWIVAIILFLICINIIIKQLSDVVNILKEIRDKLDK